MTVEMLHFKWMDETLPIFTVFDCHESIPIRYATNIDSQNGKWVSRGRIAESIKLGYDGVEGLVTPNMLHVKLICGKDYIVAQNV